jgi:hypothetical protein
LLADLDLADTVVTADALHTHRDAAEFLVVAKRAHYLLAVKANLLTLVAAACRCRSTAGAATCWTTWASSWLSSRSPSGVWGAH